MSYKIKQGSVIVAIQQDGQAVAKTATKEKLYSEAEHDKAGGWYSFKVKPGGLYAEFRVMEYDVEVAPDITAVADGTYTIVWEKDIESIPGPHDYVTIKLCTSKHPTNEDGTKNFFFGKQIVSYLSGPDNENNFQGFAHLDETGGVRIWKRFRTENMARYQLALATLQKIGGEGRSEAGLEYAMRSGRCMKCNRTLTVPASLHRGMGPQCFAGSEDKDSAV